MFVLGSTLISEKGSEAMPIRPSSSKTESTKRFATPPEISALYGVGIARLRKLRMQGVGPEFTKVGYRTVLYDIEKFEAWLAQLPRGGGG
jgi:hypothetical protein